MIVKQKLHALTSLRFIAAAMIVLGHAHHIFGSLGIANLIPLGQGVSFFFILSGFILAYNYPKFTSRDTLSRFFIARFARIWPLHFVTCILWIAIIFHFSRENFFPGITGALKLIINLLLLQSWLPYKDLALSFNGVAWSISTEMFFYMLFPLVILMWDKYWARILFLSGSLVGVFVCLNNSLKLPAGDDYVGLGMLSTLYFNPLVRVFEFLFGIALAKVYVSSAFQSIRFSFSAWLLLETFALLAVFVALVLAGDPSRLGNYFGDAGVYYFQKEGLWFVWGVLILIFALSNGPIVKALSVRPLVFLGEISFALYLIHALILAFLDNYIEKVQALGSTGVIAFWLVCLASAAVLCLGVENPCRRIIMHMWDRRSSQTSSFRRGYSVSALIYGLIVLTAGTGAYLYKPSTLDRLTPAEATALLASPRALDGAHGAFSNGAELLGAILNNKNDGQHYELTLVMRAGKSFFSDEFVALHMNDISGIIIDKSSDAMIDKNAVKIQEGAVWQQKFLVNAKSIETAASFGIAMYRRPDTLTTVVSGVSDWGGKRIIIMKSH